MSATAVVESLTPWEKQPGFYSCTIRCSENDLTTYAVWRESHLTVEEFAQQVLRDHLPQHEPGRALDIEVSWEPSALCSVCEDGIGDIHWPELETLECRECETTWHIDGTDGERKEHTDD